MKCQLIQTTKLDDYNRAEKKMLQFLQHMPGSSFLYRELNIAVINNVREVLKKKPDFVVVAPWAGTVSIEVKDWNIIENEFRWKNQNTVIKRRYNGQEEEIENPKAQADAYLYALLKLLNGIKISVTSLVAFPLIARAEFINRIPKNAWKDPQTLWYFDLSHTIFSDDMDSNWTNPEKVLEKFLRNESHYHPCTPREVEAANRILLPPSFRIGDYTKRQQNQQKLRMITEKQQQWIYNLDPSVNYLLDVAGSGKTNALISKAIHLVDSQKKGFSPRILLTTYNHNLETNIRRIFDHKISEESDKKRYLENISILCIPHLIEQMVAGYFNLDVIEYRKQTQAQAMPAEKYEEFLRNQLQDIIIANPDRYRRFDFVFIDEIQDFDDYYLIVADHLCREKRFFFVGDIGQKIFDRTHNLARIGFITESAELEKSYKMYRTPCYIAELATTFIFQDLDTRRELETHGYNQNFQYPNELDNLAVLYMTSQPAEDCAAKIESYLHNKDLAGGYTEEDILVITSEKQIEEMGKALTRYDLEWEVGEPASGGKISLVDFMNVKGLEKEVVMVTGIEDLYHHTQNTALFLEMVEDELLHQERFSRRKIYVSLTRALEHLTIFYHDGTNGFIQELNKINNRLMDKRQRK